MKLGKIAAIAFALVAFASIAQAADKQKLIIATEGAYPPYNFVAADGTLQGFDIDFANAICEKINAECEIVKQDWDGIIPALLAKKYDVIVASMAIRPERAEKVDFTIPYYMAPTALIAMKSAGIKTGADGFVDPESVAGKKIGVARATGFERYAKENWSKADIVIYDTSPNADLDLISGRLDARFDDLILMQESVLKSEIAGDLEQVGKVYPETMMGSEGEGIAVRKGENALRESINKAILDMRADGTYKKINDKYFNFDIYGQ